MKPEYIVLHVDVVSILLYALQWMKDPALSTKYILVHDRPGL